MRFLLFSLLPCSGDYCTWLKGLVSDLGGSVFSSEASYVVCIACDHPAYGVLSPFAISAIPRYKRSGYGLRGD